MDVLISLIITAIIAVVAIYIIDWLSTVIPLPPIVWVLLKILIGLAILIYLLKALGLLAGLAVLH